MGPLLSDLPGNTSSITCGVACISAALFVVAKLSLPSKLCDVPTVGPSTGLGSWWADFTYARNALDILQEGYDKHKSAPFKVAESYRWTLVLSSREHVEEVRKAPDDVISMSASKNDLLQVEHILGPQMLRNPYHIRVLRSQLTRNIGTLYPEIRDEIVTSFDDVLGLTGNEWKSVLVFSNIRKVVCRTSNRVFVGLPLCRDPDWVNLMFQYPLVILKGAALMRQFPDFLKPIICRLFTNVNRTIERGRKLLGPVIEERQKLLDEYGTEWVDKPSDFLTWLMEEAEGPELTVKSLANRMLGVNFAAIHTTAHAFTHALFYLAANPQYVKPLREEVETIVEKWGWSQAALRDMRKVDSFLKECQRLEGAGSAGLTRKALKDFTFSDGTFVPKGTKIVVPSRSIQRDEAFYQNARAFEPFRFADLREEDEGGEKHQLTSTGAEYLVFGYGRHACPGRFFVANELKSMLAHVVVTYDVKLTDNATRPTSIRVGSSMIPDPSAKVMFRRRID